MVKTIRISEEFHDWLKVHSRDDETVEETLRRLTRGPHPEEVVGVLSPEQVEAAIDDLNERESGRLRDVMH